MLTEFTTPYRISKQEITKKSLHLLSNDRCRRLFVKTVNDVREMLERVECSTIRLVLDDLVVNQQTPGTLIEHAVEHLIEDHLAQPVGLQKNVSGQLLFDE